MTFADIPAGVPVFVDANVFVYHVLSDPRLGPACHQLMQRIARQEIVAYTAADILSDVAHRVMTLEAVAAFNWPLQGIASHRKRQPAAIQQLSRFRQAVEDIAQMGVHVLPVEVPLVLTAARLSQQHGLLSGDALVVSVMQQHAITSLVSEDADFDRVPGITRYSPA